MRALFMYLRSGERQVNQIMEINWSNDADKGLAAAKGSGKPLLLDFTAAPM
jgi:hypothetical protein